jgi:hypothetical protein
MELAGKLNRQNRRAHGMFLMEVNQAAELVAELVLCAGTHDAIDRFMDEVMAAIGRRSA